MDLCLSATGVIDLYIISLTRVPWLITCLSRWREVSESTLATLCTFLVELYQDTQVKLDSTENLGTVLQFLAHIGKMIRECPPVDIMSLLPPLADGLATWIGDEYEYVPVQEYNAIVSFHKCSLPWMPYSCVGRSSLYIATLCKRLDIYP